MLADLSYDDARAHVAALDPAKKAELIRFLGSRAEQCWHPDPLNNPQIAAYVSRADLLLFGGAAGGGKSDCLIGTALTAHTNGVIFRRHAIDLRGIEERLIGIAGRDGWNASLKTMRRGTQLIELGHLDQPGSEESWRGRPHDFIGFDEGAQLSKTKVQFVLGWLRSTDPKQRRRAIIATNPPTSGDGQWLLEWFAPWLDKAFGNPATPGELRWCVTAPDQDGTIIWVPDRRPVVFTGATAWRPATDAEIASGDAEVIEPQSRTFIPSFLKDNRFLADTGYKTQLQSLPEPLRSQLLHGDFLAGRVDHEWQVMPTAWVQAAQDRWTARPPHGALMSCLGVDVAQGGGDRTIVQARYGPWFAMPVERPGASTPTGAEVAALVVAQRRDGAHVIIDYGGGYGGATALRLGDNEVPSQPYNGAARSYARTADNQLAFVNKRAEVHWRMREALDPDQPHGSPIALPPDPQVLADLTAPRWKLTPRGIQVEDKEELRKAHRLGRSPDKGDAIIMAWSEGERALRLAKRAVPPLTIGKERAPEMISERGTSWMAR